MRYWFNINLQDLHQHDVLLRDLQSRIDAPPSPLWTRFHLQQIGSTIARIRCCSHWTHILSRVGLSLNKTPHGLKPLWCGIFRRRLGVYSPSTWSSNYHCVASQWEALPLVLYAIPNLATYRECGILNETIG